MVVVIVNIVVDGWDELSGIAVSDTVDNTDTVVVVVVVVVVVGGGASHPRRAFSHRTKPMHISKLMVN